MKGEPFNAISQFQSSLINLFTYRPNSTGMKGIYEKLPGSLKTEVLVRSRQEDPEVQQARAETIKVKSVNELSQITSIDDFPLPKSIDQMIGRAPRPVERRKRFRDK